MLTTKPEHSVVTRNAMTHKSIVIHTQTNMLTENCYFLTAYNTMSTTATSNLAMAMIIDHVKAQYIQIPQ